MQIAVPRATLPFLEYSVYHSGMFELLVVVFIYSVVFGADYLWFRLNPRTYNYVSRGTYLTFLLGQLALIYLYFSRLQSFFNDLTTEVVALSILLGALIAFTVVFHVNHLKICHGTTRTELCLTPGYLFVKGADIMFQQLCFLLIALIIKDIVEIGALRYLLFAVVVLIMHTPLEIGIGKQWFQFYIFFSIVLTAPFFYTYTSLELFWPALYIHTLGYVGMWLALADMEGRKVHN